MLSRRYPRQVEEYLDSIFDVLGDGVYITDRDGMTLKVNKVYEKLTGLHRDELIGRNVGDLREEGVFNAVLNPRIVHTAKPATLVQETRTGRKLVLSGFPIIDGFGVIKLVVTFVRDITVIGSLREQVANQRKLIDDLSSIAGDRQQIIAESRIMRDRLDTLRSVAETDATVLLAGEPGVGKDFFARQVHADSFRASRPFLRVDCTAMPESRAESELFGSANRKGHRGFFEVAGGGTLFLDEVGELPLRAQSRLLHVIRKQEVMRVGDSIPRKVDVRIVAATNRDLEEEVRHGSFRKDLFYRLKVAEINIPPLRHRHGDILPLAEYFLHRFNHKHNKEKTFTKNAGKLLLHHDWPGNVRELENTIQSAVVLTNSETITAASLPLATFAERGTPRVRLPEEEGHSLKDLVCEYEHQLIQTALDKFGSLKRVAEYFGVDRSTIFRKMRQFEKP